MEKWRLYLREAHNEAQLALRCWTAFVHAEEVANLEDVFFHLHHFILHATNVDKLLDAKSGSTRQRLLADQIDLNGVDLKACRRLRNHLEHFDERLDLWIDRYDGHAFFDRNIVTGAKAFPTKTFLRALDGHTFKFHGEDYDLDEVRATMSNIAERLAAIIDPGDS